MANIKDPVKKLRADVLRTMKKNKLSYRQASKNSTVHYTTLFNFLHKGSTPSLPTAEKLRTFATVPA